MKEVAIIDLFAKKTTNKQKKQTKAKILYLVLPSTALSVIASEIYKQDSYRVMCKINSAVLKPGAYWVQIFFLFTSSSTCFYKLETEFLFSVFVIGMKRSQSGTQINGMLTQSHFLSQGLN